jgi:hypothetical protein
LLYPVELQAPDFLLAFLGNVVKENPRNHHQTTENTEILINLKKGKIKFDGLVKSQRAKTGSKSFLDGNRGTNRFR